MAAGHAVDALGGGVVTDQQGETSEDRRTATNVLGFILYQGPEVPPPSLMDFTRPRAEIEAQRARWAQRLDEAVRDEDAWAVLITKPNGDVLLFDTRRESLETATAWGGTAHLLLAKEARS